VELNGAPAIEDTAVRQKLADFFVRAKALQHTGNRTVSALSQGKTPGPEASLGKLVGAVLIQEMAAYGIELEGAAGALNDEVYTPHAADEVLRNIIAERVLRLPPEARADKGIAFKDIPTGPPSK
jgi:acyl-CoA dehydrogenase